jgi:hypothetical protein
MRINLVTPFAEKDAVKALGARWDPKIKVWYVTDAPDLTPFARWIPDVKAATKPDAAGATFPAPAQRLHAPVRQARAPIAPKPRVDVPHCGCNVLPWDDCVHTRQP